MRAGKMRRDAPRLIAALLGLFEIEFETITYREFKRRVREDYYIKGGNRQCSRTR